MHLLGSAAMLLSFDVDTEAIDEHDRRHTHEHLPECLSTPTCEQEGLPGHLVADLPLVQYHAAQVLGTSDLHLSR